MKKMVIFTFLNLLLITLTGQFVFAKSDRAGGGGGKKEPLFQIVAENISKWIQVGNADLLSEVLIANGLTLQEYKKEMQEVLSNFHITFTDEKVMINGKEKTCRGYVDNRNINQILCNNTQFGSDNSDNINEIYRQVHHEFAGLACRKDKRALICIEKNNGEESDYRISNHVTSLLGEETVWRLPINPIQKTRAEYLSPAEALKKHLTEGGRTVCRSIVNILSSDSFKTIFEDSELAVNYPELYTLNDLYSKHCTLTEQQEKIGSDLGLLSQLNSIGGVIVGDGALTSEQKSSGLNLSNVTLGIMQRH